MLSWKSVKDSLPNCDEPVWVVYKFKGEEKQYQGYAVLDSEQGWWFELHNLDPLTEKYAKEVGLDLEFAEVTHWQKLPDLPRYSEEVQSSDESLLCKDE